MAVLGSIFAGSWAMSGSSAKPKTAEGPPINASSKEEGDFIQYVPAPAPAPVPVSDDPMLLLDWKCASLIRVADNLRNFLKEVDGGDKKSEKH